MDCLSDLCERKSAGTLIAMPRVISISVVVEVTAGA